jgi:nitrate/nitrite-specific signal transduction histidine kinase
MTELQRLKWLAVVLPVAFAALLYFLADWLLHPRLSAETRPLVLTAAVAGGALVFSTIVFRTIERLQQHLVRQNRELSRRERETQALYQLGLKIASEAELDNILKLVVEESRLLLHADLAALCLDGLGTQGHSLAAFAGSLTPRRGASGLPPNGGLLVDDPSASCPLQAGAPGASPLAAPLRAGAGRLGELCVAAADRRDFSPAEAELLGALADMAAIAINNARLRERERYTAVLEERDRLAREMHDSLAQVLGYLHLKARTLEKAAADDGLGDLEDGLGQIASAADEAYCDVREAIVGLRESLAEGGLGQALVSYLEKFRRQTGIAAALEMANDMPSELRPDVEVQLLRVVQEALSNVRKHAGARRAWVRLQRHNGWLTLSIEDKGRGFDLASVQNNENDRFGLRTMKERVERIGGVLDIETERGRGTKVIARLPAEAGNHVQIAVGPRA